MATNRPCAYGPAEVAEAIEAGAVETLLVSDAVVRNPGIEDLMRSAESARGAVVLVSRHHEAGQKLEALGGIAALLRVPIKWDVESSGGHARPRDSPPMIPPAS